MLFSSIGNKSVEHQHFAQPNPPHVCKQWMLFLRISSRQGYECKCREARCSLSCYANWRAKEAHVLRRFITHHLPEDTTTYRGNLTLKAGSNVDDHKIIVGKFLRTIRRREKQTGHTIRVYMTAHVTSPDAMHYDLLAYSNATAHKFRDIIRDAWLKAGGLRYSLVGIDTEGERIKAAKYNAKDMIAERNRYVYLPAKNGLNLTRYSSGFFTDTSKEELWQECIRDWFGETNNPDLVSNNDRGFYDTIPAPKTTPTDPTEDELDRMKTLDLQVRDYALRLVRGYLPHDPDKAMTLDDLSRKVSIPRDWLRRLLHNLPGSEWVNNGYWFRWGSSPPVPGSEAVGPLLDTDRQEQPEVSRHHPDERSDGRGDGLSERSKPVAGEPQSCLDISEDISFNDKNKIVALSRRGQRQRPPRGEQERHWTSSTHPTFTDDGEGVQHDETDDCLIFSGVAVPLTPA